MRILAIFFPIALIGIVSLWGVKTVSKADCCAEQATQAKEGSAKKPQTFACSLTALTAEQRKRHAELRKVLGESIKEVQELPDGYAFRLPDDAKTIVNAAEFITYEKRCCPFFKFNLEIESNSQPVWLKLTGQEGVKQFLKTEFGVQ